jgi:hypothetical protein
MSIIQNYQSSRNFSCLSLPVLKSVPESLISSLFNSPPCLQSPIPNSTRPSNPISYIKTTKGIDLFYSFHSTLNKLSITKSRSKLKSSKKFSIKLDSEIHSLSLSNPKDSSSFLLIQTSKGFQRFSLNLESEFNFKSSVSEVHLNPYYPSQVVFLKENEIHLQNERNSRIRVENIDRFDFEFSPYIFTLNNSSSIYRMDIREGRQHQVYLSNFIQQVLPIDCCFSFAVLNDGVELVDCRYFKPYKNYSHLSFGGKRVLFTSPGRPEMYKSGTVGNNEQDLFCLSKTVEKLAHGKNEFLDETLSSFVPVCFDSGCIQPSISGFSSLFSAIPCKIMKNRYWLQVCTGGGVYIENSSSVLFYSELCEKAKISSKARLKTCKKYDQSKTLESLLSSQVSFPESKKPILPYNLQPMIYDFDD